MEFKFLREHHARQEKAKKPDYREEYWPTSTGGSSSSMERLLEKAQERKRFCNLYERATYIHQGLKILNGEDPTTLTIYQKTKAIAQQDLANILKAIRQGDLRLRKTSDLLKGITEVQTSLRFQVKTECEEVRPPKN